MARIKQQHYVPQFYLRAFTDDSGRLYCYDKKAGKIFPSSPHDVAGEQLFYEVPGLREAVPVDQFIEKFFNPIEGATASVITDLLGSLRDGSFKRLSDDQRGLLALHLAIQLIRTKESRLQFVEMYEKLGEAHFRAHLETIRPDLANAHFSLAIDEAFYSTIHASHILNPKLHQELANILYSHYWVILKSATDTVFYTSDQPLSRQSHFKHAFLSMSGIGSLGIELAFPLSPHFTLILMDRNAFHDYGAHDGTLMGTASASNMDYYNSLQTREAYRFVFSLGSNFELAHLFCEKYPENRDPDRERIQVEGGPWPAMRTEGE